MQFLFLFQISHLPTERAINYLKTVPFSLALIIISHFFLCRIKPVKTTHRTKYCGGKLLLMLLMVSPCVCHFAVWVLLKLPEGGSLQGLNSFSVESVPLKAATSYRRKQ